MFTNAKQSIPECFIEKIKADKEWSFFIKQDVLDIKQGRIKRGSVLRERMNCQRFISRALKP